MAVLTKHFRSAASLFKFLDRLLTDDQADWLFRGQANSAHRLCTSLERYWSIPHEEWMSTSDNHLDQFRDGLIAAGVPVPETTDRLAWLELARHHGVPSPLLDFSWSPFVALFFAFNRLSHERSRDKKYSTLYALNTKQLAGHWAKALSSGPLPQNYAGAYRAFISPSPDVFKESLPENYLQLLPWAGEHAGRMQRQMGAFLYCTLNYGWRKTRDLEAYIDSFTDTYENRLRPGTGYPTLLKLKLPHSFASAVFPRLELMHINGAALLDSADGVADDVWNAFNYNRKLYLRTEKKVGDA